MTRYIAYFSTFIILTFFSSVSFSQSYAPPAGQTGTTAIHKDSSIIKGWATGIVVHRGYIQISDTTKYHEGSNRATFGTDENALGKPTGNPTDAISLGDSGWAILTFDAPISNYSGWDFVVFENGHSDNYLELAFVEVSSDGQHFFRFPAHSELSVVSQIDGFSTIDCRYINNFAGKYRVGYGTPFDLEDVVDTSLLDKNNIRYVKIIDVIGSIDPQFASYDAFGNIVNDPFSTPFYSSGFDLTGIGIIHSSDTTLHVNNTQEMEKWKVYPTVFETKIYIETIENGIFTLSSLEGKIIRQGAFVSGTNEIETSNFPSGMYVLQLVNGEYIKTYRLIK